MSKADLPQNWALKRLGDLASTIQYGYTAKAQQEKVGPKMLRITDIQDGSVSWDAVPFCNMDESNKAKYLLSNGDLVFARTGATVGKSFLIRGAVPETVFASYLIRVRLREQIDSKYVSYFFKSPQYWRQISENQAGIGQPNVNGKKLSQLLVPVAPPDQQKRIVAEIEKQFSRLDEAVANLKRVTVNLKRYKAAVLKAAVEGKLTEEWRKAHPNVEPASELLKRILAERRAKWTGKGKYKEPAAPDTANLPALPETWTWATADQIAKVQLGKMLDRQKHRTGRSLPYLRNVNVRWGSISTDDFLEMFFKETELDRYGLKEHDVLICEGGEPGRAAVWDGRRPEMKYQKALHRVRFYGDYQPRLFVFYLERLAKTGRLARWFTGTTIKHFTRESLVELPVPVPPLPEQEQIVAEVEQRLSVLDKLEAVVLDNLHRVRRLRESVLQRAFCGNILHTPNNSAIVSNE